MRLIGGAAGRPWGVATGGASGLTGWGEHLYCTTSARTWQARSFDLPDANPHSTSSVIRAVRRALGGDERTRRTKAQSKRGPHRRGSVALTSLVMVEANHLVAQG
jgi:hypothetical protein